MATYLYGLALSRNASRLPSVGEGVAGTSVRALSCSDAGLTALVSTVATTPTASVAVVRAHDAALQRAVDAGVTVAAVRFGQTFADDRELCRHLAEHGGATTRVLESSDGCVEMRVLLPGAERGKVDVATDLSDAEDTGPGTAYLRSIKVRVTPVEDDRAVAGPLASVVRAQRVEDLPHPGGMAFVHLVARDQLAAYREVVGAMPLLERGTVVGPLALYTFAAGGGPA